MSQFFNESFKVGWYPLKKPGRVTLKRVLTSYMVSVGTKLNSMGTDGKLLLSEISITRNRSSAGCLKYFRINNSFDFTSTDQRHTLDLGIRSDTRHYGIIVLIPQTSIRGETSVAKCPLFSQAVVSLSIETLI